MKMQTKKIGEIFQLAGRDRADLESFPVMSITMHHGLIDQSDKFKKRIASANTSNYKIVCKNELVVGFPIDEGVIGFQTKYSQAIVSPAYDIWKLKNGISCNIDYLGRYLRSDAARRIYESKMRGAVARRRSITKDDFLAIQIPFPNLDDQICINIVLTRAEKLIAKRKASIKALDELLKSTFLEMFGDTTKPKATNIVKTIEEICKFKGGGTPSKAKPEYFRGNIPWVSPKDMKSLYIYTSIDKITKEAIINSSTSLVPKGSVLMVVRSGILKKKLPVAINTVDVTINQDMKAFNSKVVVAPYLLYFFISNEKMMLKKVRATTADNFNFEDIKKMKIMIPPLPLQNQFATIVEKVESLKAKYIQSLTDLENLYGSLSQRAFKGELDLHKVTLEK